VPNVAGSAYYRTGRRVWVRQPCGRASSSIRAVSELTERTIGKTLATDALEVRFGEAH
jgi:hypothetical protein